MGYFFLEKLFGKDNTKEMSPEERLKHLSSKLDFWHEDDNTLEIAFYGEKESRNLKGDILGLYIAKQGKKIWPRIVMGYSIDIAYPPIFFDTIFFNIDGEKYRLIVDSEKDTKTSDLLFGISKRCEKLDIHGEKLLPIMRKIVPSEKTFLRFTGTQYHHEAFVSPRHKEALRKMLQIYDLELSISNHAEED